MAGNSCFSFYLHAKKQFFDTDWQGKISGSIDPYIDIAHGTPIEICLGEYEEWVWNDFAGTYNNCYDGLYLHVVFFFDCNQILVLLSSNYRSCSAMNEIEPLTDSCSKYISNLESRGYKSFSLLAYNVEINTICLSFNNYFVGHARGKSDEVIDKLDKAILEDKNRKVLGDRRFLSMLKEKFYKAKSVMMKKNNNK